MNRLQTDGQDGAGACSTARPLLIGNSFPFTLIRRQVVITPQEIGVLKGRLQTAPFVSFWGHANTIAVARRILGVDLTPRTPRPVIALDADGLPELEGISFRKCWIVSPDYIPGFRPSMGEEVTQDKLAGWQVLKMDW